MVFNSSQNNLNSNGSQAESLDVLKNSYNVSEGGYDYQPALRPVNKDYMYPSAVHASMSHYNQNELKYLNHDTMRTNDEKHGAGVKGIPRHIRKVMPRDDDEMIGEGIFKKARKATKKATKSVKNTTTKAANKTSNIAKSGAKATKKGAEKLNRDTKPLQKQIAKSVTDEDGLLHKAISKTLDSAIPMAGEALGTAVGAYSGNPALGAMVGKQGAQVGRNHLKSKTGYGVQGVGKYNDKGNIDLEKTLSKYAPQYKTDVIRQYKPAVCKKPASGRCEIVKQIMKEKGLSLPQASKYVKQNKLW
jgi:hypothetical protein